MADLLPADVYLNNFLRTTGGFARGLQGPIQAAYNTIPNKDLLGEVVGPLINPLIPTLSYGAKAFSDLGGSSALAAAVPDVPETGSARRGPDGQIQLYSGDSGQLGGWRSPAEYVARWGALPARMKGNPNPDATRAAPPATPPVHTPPASNNPPGNNNPAPTGFNPAVQAQIGFDPNKLNTNIGKETANSNLDLLGLIRETNERMTASQAANWERVQQASTTAQQSAMEKSRETTARNIELENIKAWRDITQAKIEAQTRSNLAVAGMMTLAQQPNVGYMNAASQLFQAGAAPFTKNIRIG